MRTPNYSRARCTLQRESTELYNRVDTVVYGNAIVLQYYGNAIVLQYCSSVILYSKIYYM